MLKALAEGDARLKDFKVPEGFPHKSAKPRAFNDFFSFGVLSDERIVHVAGGKTMYIDFDIVLRDDEMFNEVLTEYRGRCQLHEGSEKNFSDWDRSGSGRSYCMGSGHKYVVRPLQKIGMDWLVGG